LLTTSEPAGDPGLRTLIAFVALRRS